MVLPMWTMLSLWSSHGCSRQGCKATNHTGTLRNLPSPNTHQNPPEPSGTRLRNLHQHTPGLSGTFRNLPEPSGTFWTLPRPSGTNLSQPSGTRLRNLRQHTPEPSGRSFYSGTLRNLPEPDSGTYASIRRNPPEPSGTRLRNLHQHTPELSPTFGNRLRNLHQHTPEPSGTRLRNLHQHTPELSGTFRNLPPEPAPATLTDTHRSLSGLKTPLAYAVGEQCYSKKNTLLLGFDCSLLGFFWLLVLKDLSSSTRTLGPMLRNMFMTIHLSSPSSFVLAEMCQAEPSPRVLAYARPQPLSL